MNKLKIVKLNERAKLPKYESVMASGFDIAAVEDCRIPAMKTTVVKTGIAVELPRGTELQIRARSGMSLRTPLIVKNGIGTIDEDYRGEIGVIMHNVSGSDFVIFAGDRIAQGVVCPVVRCEIVEVHTLEDTERGAGGFGSTGV